MTAHHPVPSRSAEYPEEEPKLLPIMFETNMVSRVQHFYISEEIGDPIRYVEMIHRIKTAGPNEVIYIYLNTPGGQIATGIQIISAMKMSQAHIITVIEGEVASLGTLIFLSGDEFIVHDHCLFMIHNFSGGVQGKGHEQVAMLKGTVKWYTELAEDVYFPFLSHEELDAITNGGDLYLTSNDIRDRLTNMVEILEKERLEEEADEAVPKKKVAPKKRAPAKKKSKKT